MKNTMFQTMSWAQKGTDMKWYEKRHVQRIPASHLHPETIQYKVMVRLWSPTLSPSIAESTKETIYCQGCSSLVWSASTRSTSSPGQWLRVPTAKWSHLLYCTCDPDGEGAKDETSESLCRMPHPQAMITSGRWHQLTRWMNTCQAVTGQRQRWG